jgi:tetratricopeptide (TPR) repeat protein
MKTKLCLLILVLATTLARAQTNDLTSLLQQGLLEEQANRNLDAAITDYKALATQFDKNWQIAATAIFRLGECYRMQGRTNEAAAQYQRILSDFSDQQTLVTMSREDLTGMGMTANGGVPAGAMEQPATTQENTDVALWNKLKDLPKSEAEKILLVLYPDPSLAALMKRRDEAEANLAIIEVDYSSTNVVVLRVKSVLAVLDQQINDRTDVLLAALKMRAQIADANPAAGMPGSNDSTDPESQEIQRIQTMIQNSPDLINATAPGNDGTPLSKAARDGWIRVANYLLAHGADVNANSS